MSQLWTTGTAGGAGLSVCMCILTHSGTSHPHTALLEGLSRHSWKSGWTAPCGPSTTGSAPGSSAVSIIPLLARDVYSQT